MKFLIIFENLSPENIYLLFGDKKKLLVDQSLLTITICHKANYKKIEIYTNLFGIKLERFKIS